MTQVLDSAAMGLSAILGLVGLAYFFSWMLDERSAAARLVSRIVFGLVCAAGAGVLVRGVLRLAGLL